MQRHHRDLLTALLILMLGLLALLAWGTLARARQGPVMAVADAPISGTPAPPGPAQAPPAPVPASPPAAATLRVHIVGAVRQPAVYTLPRGSRVIDAVEKAGGTSSDADLERI